MKPGEVLAMHFPTMKPTDTPKAEKAPEKLENHNILEEKK